MATKVSELITGAHRLSNITPLGEALTAEETAEGLRVLNQMLAAWSVDRQGVYTITKEDFTVTSGDNEYSIGSGADYDTTRPNRITHAQVRQGNIDYNVKIVDREWMESRQNKSTLTGRPWEILYEPTYPNGTITFYPLPDQNYTLRLQSVKPLAVYTSANDNLNLPPEYEQAIEYNLAIALANRYGQTVGGETANIADTSLRKLKRLHTDPVKRTTTRIAGVGVQRDYDIVGDYYFR